MPIDMIMAHPDRLPAGSVEFFLFFTRVEFALKHCGFLRKHGDALPRWNAFANALGNDFWREVRDSGRAATLINEPPHEQHVCKSRLRWRLIPRPRNSKSLFHAVKTVRNNLVHGGKHGMPDNPPQNPNRNPALIAEARWVLEQALELHPEVRAAFEGRI